MADYELHITMLGDGVPIRKIVEEMGWHYSVIDADPDLGGGVRHYATKHCGNLMEATGVIAHAVEEIAKRYITVKRAKIEQVLYDVRF